MRRHVEKKEIDDDPEKDHLNEIENVDGIESAKFKIRFEKEHQARGTEPKNGDDVGNIGCVLGTVNGLHVKVAERRDAEERNGKGCNIPKIARQMGGSACSSQHKKETKKIEKQVTDADERRAGPMGTPVEDHSHLRARQKHNQRNPKIVGQSGEEFSRVARRSNVFL